MEVYRTKSAGGVVVNSEGKVIIVKQEGKSWSLPKGHIEEGETDLEASKREIYEESGVKQLELIKKLGSYERRGITDPSEIKTITVFLFKTSEKILNPIDPENPEAMWVNKEEAANIFTHPKDKEFFLKIINEI
jgi:8-oxo-dGTP pyrophosphatase MutT (NUDIX family)